jgi:hypothetical protein
MGTLKDFFESSGKEVDPIISEISLMKQLIKERVHPLDLIRELLSNAGAKEVGASEIRINYYVNQDGHVFEVWDNGCGMTYTGNRNLPGRLDRFLGLGLSAIIGQKADEFSWKGLGSKLAYQSKRVEIETYRAGDPEVIKAEVNEPWGTISRNKVPKPRIYRFPPEAMQNPGTTIKVFGHPPHKKENPFTLKEIETFLRHRTFAGFTKNRENAPRIFLTVSGQEQKVEFGFPELALAKSCEGTQLVHETLEAKQDGTNIKFPVALKGFYTWDAESYGLDKGTLNTGLILSVKGIPYLTLDMEEYGSQSLRTANPGEKKCCFVAECDAIQEEMNISRSGLVDSAITDLFKKTVASIFRKIESSQEYFDFRKVSKRRKTIASASALEGKKRTLESAGQRWVAYTDSQGNYRFLGREPENEQDTLNLLWKLEAIGGLPFAKFQTLAHAGSGPDLIVHFQEDSESQPDRYTVIEAERFFYNYKAHGHAPAQYPRVICWDIGTKAARVEDTKKRHKKLCDTQGVQVNIFCIRHMPGISVMSRRGTCPIRS